ncbi:MAG: EAL domain-containing protein [Methylophagaceae bacterium]
MAFFKKHQIFLTLTLIIVIANTIFTVISYYQLKDRLHKEEQQRVYDVLAAYNIAYKATEKNMLQIANLFAHNPEYQSLFLAGKRAVEQEGGGTGKEQAKKARDELYTAVLPSWESLNDISETRILQFHLAPGSTSFLRVHQPKKFGDNMDTVRHTIVATNKYKQEVTGFETGRIYSGIRGTSPVSIINEAGVFEHLGTVEAGVSFSAVLEQLLLEFDVHAAIMLNETHLRENVWPDILKVMLTERPLINGLFIEQTTSDQITNLLTEKSKHQHNDADLHSAIKVIHVEGRDYLYASQPLHDYQSTIQADNPSGIGQIIIWEDITELYAEFNHSLFLGFLFGLLTFILMELMLFWAIGAVSSQLNKTIDKQKRHQEELELIAHYDPLTKLPNRTLFNDRFNQAIARSKRSNTKLAICFLDLDNFKPINDNFGHDTGDQLLIKVAKRLHAIIREEDTISRQGGDEFALLLADFHTSTQCIALLKRIHKSLSEPYIINGITHQISASSGTTLYPLDNADPDTLLRHADQAMYQAKLAGKNGYHIFDISDDQKVLQHQIKLQEIEHALVSNEFQLYYQPKINMITGQIFGCEALIRWIHPEKGLIPPLDFLPLIEGTELELRVGNWVIEHALAQLNEWHQQKMELEVSINVSSPHLQSPTFIEHLRECLALYPDLDSKYFQLELLESSALGDLKAINKLITSCQQDLGLHVALDDFGTGYSSLTHIRNLSVDIIKIDQSFVKTMLDDPHDFSIIDGLIGLAHAFSRDIIAEGVESTQHGLMLMIMGCHIAQGYGIARPMPAEALPAWVKDYTPNEEWLNYGKLHLSIKERRIKLVQLTTHYWFAKFKRKLDEAQTTGNKEWPYMKHTQCHHGAWIKRAYKERLFDKDWLESLEVDHEAMHAIAEQLIHKYQANESDISENDFEQVRIAFDKMIIALDNYT